MTRPDLQVVFAENERDAASGEISKDIQHDPLRSSRFTRVPDGVYLIGYVEYRIIETYRRLTCVSEFVIERGPLGEPELDLGGYRVRRYVAQPRPTQYPSLLGNFAKDFTQSIGLNPPGFLHRLTPDDIYGDCVLKARIGEVVKDADGDPLPDGARKSVVRKIIARIEGVPPYLARRGGSPGG